MAETGTDRVERVPEGLLRVAHTSVATLLASSASPLAHAVSRVCQDALRSDQNYAAFGNTPQHSCSAPAEPR
jgi:hypothetical protein